MHFGWQPHTSQGFLQPGLEHEALSTIECVCSSASSAVYYTHSQVP